MQKFCYDVIDNKSNSFIYMYLSLSGKQINTFLPLKRSKLIQQSIWFSLTNGDKSKKTLTDYELSIIIPLINSYHKYFSLWV